MMSKLIEEYKLTKDFFYAFCLFWLIFISYLSLLHLNMAHAHDAPTYYLNIMTLNGVWHSHHLLYGPFSFVWFDIMKFVFSELHPFKLISSLNSLFGAGCIAFIYLIMRLRMHLPRVKSLIISIMIASTFFYVNYTTTVEVYHIPLFFILFLFFYISKASEISVYDAAMIGILHGLAMSFHQMHFLFGIAILLRMSQEHYSKTLIYFIYGTIIVVFSYLLACYFQIIHNSTDFIQFFSGYLDAKSHIPSGTSSPILAPLGFGLSILGGRYIMSIEPFKSFILQQFPDALYERIFHLHHQTSDFSGIIQILSYIVFFICVILILKKFIKNNNQNGWSCHFKTYQLYYSIIVIYSLFFTFWYPHNPEFWGLQMTFLILVICASIKNNSLLLITASAILLINLLGSALPLLNPENNLYPDTIQGLF